MKKDPFNLERFVRAQNSEYAKVRSELKGGRKQGHWMWFIFPQIAGLGSSTLAVEFAISSRAEAEAYLKHPTLGERLRECTRLVLKSRDKPIKDIFGYPDYCKFRSSMTLFAKVDLDDDNIFMNALKAFYQGELDPLTLERI